MAFNLSNEGFGKKLVSLVEKSPWVCAIIFLCARDLYKDSKQWDKDELNEKRHYEISVQALKNQERELEREGVYLEFVRGLNIRKHEVDTVNLSRTLGDSNK